MQDLDKSCKKGTYLPHQQKGITPVLIEPHKKGKKEEDNKSNGTNHITKILFYQ